MAAKETRTLTYKSLSLKSEDLDQLESVLLKDSSYDYKKIEVSFGTKNLTRTIETKSLKDILDDPTLPEVLQSLSMYFRGQKNNLHFHAFSDYITIITVEGESD